MLRQEGRCLVYAPAVIHVMLHARRRACYTMTGPDRRHRNQLGAAADLVGGVDG
jgi:hypothetical protein